MSMKHVENSSMLENTNVCVLLQWGVKEYTISFFIFTRPLNKWLFVIEIKHFVMQFDVTKYVH
jgi:hypothetical protein